MFKFASDEKSFEHFVVCLTIRGHIDLVPQLTLVACAESGHWNRIVVCPSRTAWITAFNSPTPSAGDVRRLAGLTFSMNGHKSETDGGLQLTLLDWKASSRFLKVLDVFSQARKSSSEGISFCDSRRQVSSQGESLVILIYEVLCSYPSRISAHAS